MDLNQIFNARVADKIRVTRDCFDALPKPEKPVDPRAAKVLRVVKSKNFGGYKNAALELIEAILGEDISTLTGQEYLEPTLAKGVIVVPTDAEGHDYTIGVPLEWPKNGKSANDIWRSDAGHASGRTLHSSQVRAATDAEIAAYMLARMTGVYEPIPEAQAA